MKHGYLSKKNETGLADLDHKNETHDHHEALQGESSNWLEYSRKRELKSNICPSLIKRAQRETPPEKLNHQVPNIPKTRADHAGRPVSGDKVFKKKIRRENIETK